MNTKALCSNIAVEKSSGRQKKLEMSKVVVRKDDDLGFSKVKITKISEFLYMIPLGWGKRQRSSEVENEAVIPYTLG